MYEEIFKIFFIITLHSLLLIGLIIRLEDSITVMATGICTKIFFNHAVKYTIHRPSAN